MSEQIFYTYELPRQLNLPFRLRSVSFMKNHLFFNKNRVLHVDLVTVSFNKENKVLPTPNPDPDLNAISTLPSTRFIRKGTLLNTTSTRKHDELLFTFIPEDADTVARLFSPPCGFFHMNPKISAVIEEIIETMECIFVPGCADRLDLLFLRLLGEMSLAINQRSDFASQDPVIYKIISYINVHFNECITLEDVCKKFSISLRTLYRHWKENFNDSPAEFLLKKRLVYAEHLLLTANIGIQDAARSCGFSNPIYFTQCFRRKHGISPSAYRKKYLTDQKTT